MGNKKVKTKYRLFITEEKNDNPLGKPLWEGHDVEDPELRKQHCLCLTYMGSRNSNGININGSKLEKGVKITSVSVQESKHKNASGKRVWDDYDYINPLRQPVRYM